MKRGAIVFFAIIASGCGAQRSAKLNFEGRSARSSIDSSVIEAVLTVRNVGSRTARVPKPPCPLRVFAYSAADRKGEPLWQSRGVSCLLDMMAQGLIEISPGYSHDFTARVKIPNELRGRLLFLSIELPTIGWHPAGSLKQLP